MTSRQITDIPGILDTCAQPDEGPPARTAVAHTAVGAPTTPSDERITMSQDKPEPVVGPKTPGGPTAPETPATSAPAAKRPAAKSAESKTAAAKKAADVAPEPVAAPEPADAPAPAPATPAPAPAATAFVPPSAAPATPSTGYGAASGYGLATSPEAEEFPVETALRATVTGPSLIARLGAELFGTFVVLLAGLGTALFASFSGAQALGVALAFGFGAIAAYLAVGHVSGGHFNPAVTLGSAIAGRTPWGHVLPYWAAQLVGGALASAILFVAVSSFPALAGAERRFFASAANGYNAHSPLALSTNSAEGFSLLAALMVEAVLVAVLVGVYLAVTDRRRTHSQAGVAIGLTLAVATLVATPVTNAALNPVRATAAAIFSEGWAWGQLWVFWVAPLVGAALAAMLYRAFASVPEDDEVIDEELELDEVDVAIERS